MKNKYEVIERAICLLCFADRCALEDKIFDGVRRSLSERENQRKVIIKWLKEKGYFGLLTKTEKETIETPVINKTNNEILYLHKNYECIEPLLWSVGLVDKLTNYNNFVLDNLHLPLKIGPNHTLESTAKHAFFRLDDEINRYREISMLWYWRCLECRNNLNKQNYAEIIKSIFGDSYIDMLKDYDYFDNLKGDFIVRGKIITELSDIEIKTLELIAERRLYAFEWLCSDENWDSVSLIC